MTMIIYPFPPQELDDATLSEQIQAIAQTLCNVHHARLHKMESIVKGQTDEENLKAAKLTHMEMLSNYLVTDIPLPFTKVTDYERWCVKCLANYLKLVERGLACDGEHLFRINVRSDNEMRPILEWARDNAPDLRHEVRPSFTNEKGNSVSVTYAGTPFPLVMPGEFIEDAKITNPERWGHVSNVIYAYRKYYCSKLSKDAKWTRREKPEWLK